MSTNAHLLLGLKPNSTFNPPETGSFTLPGGKYSPELLEADSTDSFLEFLSSAFFHVSLWLSSCSDHHPRIDSFATAIVFRSGMKLNSSAQIISVMSSYHSELLLPESSRPQFPIWSRPYSHPAMSLPLLLRTLLLTPPSPSQLQVSMLSPESMDTKNSALCLAKLASASSYQALPSRIKVQLDRRASMVKLSIFASRPPSFVEFLF
ncbi:unnamed protein product [Brassica napus]|nr:unnamed protein product [Brassica napus]